jgi:CheY-like chemotaxis protein
MVGKKIDGVFLIDDDSINNYINARLIKRIGISYELSISLNGKEALVHLRALLSEIKKCPSLILLDINMPVMDGFEFVEAFQKMEFENKEEVRIVMLTTSENTKDMEKVKNNPKISDYLNKPLTEDKLTKVLERLF